MLHLLLICFYFAMIRCFGFEGCIWVLIVSVPGLWIRFSFMKSLSADFMTSLSDNNPSDIIEASWPIRTRIL